MPKCTQADGQGGNEQSIESVVQNRVRFKKREIYLWALD